MRTLSVDYRKDDKKPGTPFNRGFFVQDLPRPLLICRTLGHRPVIDGYGPHAPGLHAARWVCCGRCGTRPDPQGVLDSATFKTGDHYAGPHDAAKNPRRHLRNPGPWPTAHTWDLGGQLILGKSFPGWSIEFKVGNCSSEHVLEAHVRLHPFGAVYLHTEHLGTWLQRRLNPTGYQSRVTGLAIQHGGIGWKLWAKRDESSRDDPWWQHGTIKLDPRDRMFGRRRYDYEDIGEPVTVLVRMPHGDDHQVTLQLQRCTFGRTRRRKFHSWNVDWECRGGIPTKPYGGEVIGSAVEASAAAVDNGTWPAEAAGNITADLAQTRARCGLRELPAKEVSGGA